MVLAAIDAQLNGKELLAKHPDPFGDGPFEAHDTEAGLELRSKLIVDGKPVSLTFAK